MTVAEQRDASACGFREAGSANAVFHSAQYSGLVDNMDSMSLRCDSDVDRWTSDKYSLDVHFRGVDEV